jgi:hypothetical protein
VPGIRGANVVPESIRRKPIVQKSSPWARRSRSISPAFEPLSASSMIRIACTVTVASAERVRNVPCSLRRCPSASVAFAVTV